MLNETEFERYFSPEPLEKQVPSDFTKVLEKFWVKHFGEGDTDFSQHHLRYDENQHFFFVIQQYLVESGFVSEPTAVEDLARPFKGISVCTVGGVEGRVMAEMGADVVNIDPLIEDAPKLNLPNLTEIASPLNSDLAQQYKGSFDIVLSSGLIDNESGFTRDIPESAVSKHCRDFFLLMLDVLKPNGTAILRGNLVHLAVRETLELINIKNVFPVKETDQITSPDTIFVIQRKDKV